jgi:hypothetical protein
VRSGIPAWPRLDSGELDLNKDAFKLMSHIPAIARLHALRDSLGVITRAKLPIGKDGRNRPKLFPFGTVTGRNGHAQSLFNAHAAMRSFMVFAPGSIGAYLDWRSQEVAIAAADYDDRQLIADYLAGDINHALALMCGITSDADPIKWKKENPEQRNRMKALQFGINYGMGVPSLARGLDRHPVVAAEIMGRHKRRYPVYWRRRAEVMQQAMLERRIESIFGWPLRISTSPNKRTLYNFPMQSGGAEMLRLATMRLCDAGIVPVMLIHDGILFEESDPEKLDHAREIMVAAGRECCNGLKVDADFDQRLENGARYRDKRDVAKEIMDVLRSIGALSEAA